MKDKFFHFPINNRVVVIDLESNNFVSLKSSYFQEEDLDNPNSIVAKALNTKNKTTLIEKRNKINSIYLFVTDECNLSCDFCCMRSDKKTIIKEISLENLEYAICTLKVLNPRKIIISGGEPLLNSNLINIIRKLKEELSSNISIQTNGTLLTDDKIDKICEFVDSIEISTAHYKSLELLEKAIAYCISKKLEVYISFTYKNNIETLYKVIDLAVRYNIYFMLNFINNMGSARSNAVKILTSEDKIYIFKKIAEYIKRKSYYDEKVAKIFFKRLLVRKSCNALGKMLAVFPDGNSYICHSLNHSDFLVGNIFQNTPYEIYNAMDQMVKNNKVSKLLEVDGKIHCKDCKYKYLCGGFCGALEYEGELNVDECVIKKMLIVYTLQYYSSEKNNCDNLIEFINFCDTYKNII